MARTKNAARDGRIILCIDEGGLSCRPCGAGPWAPGGQTPILQYSFSREQLSVIADLSYWRFCFRLFSGALKSPQFVESLQALQATTGKNLPAIWDRLRASLEGRTQEHRGSARPDRDRLPAAVRAGSAPAAVRGGSADALGLAAVTYVPTDEGTLYLAAVLDVFSRYAVGWAMAARLGSHLVRTALEMAYAQRRPKRIIHHSDHGSEYTAVAFSSRCRELGITMSMGSVGDCFDNAMMESFFSSLEAEVLDRYHFKTREEARAKIFCWLEGWYNTHRRHSAIAYLSPREYERRFSHKHTRPSDAFLPHSRETALR